MELRICVPFNSRNTAWASFDGRGRVELKRRFFMKISRIEWGALISLLDRLQREITSR